MSAVESVEVPAAKGRDLPPSMVERMTLILDAFRGPTTRLTLEHIAHEDEEGLKFWDQFGPGAVGVGWDLALLGLAVAAVVAIPAWNQPAVAAFEEMVVIDNTATIAELGPREVWVTHGREEALIHWCMTRQIKARELNLVGYEDEDD